MAAATFPEHEIASDSPAAEPARKRKKSVLLIEDNEEAMHWVQHSLKKYGAGKYELEWKECLSDGLSRLLKGGIDLILLDLGLPDCASPFTVAWVHQAAPKAPIIVLTGDSSEESGVSPLTRGISRYLVKGHVSPLGLVEVICDSLGASAHG